MSQRRRGPRIVVVGSVNVDLVVKTGRIPRPGETVLGGDFRIAAGGKGANQAVAAARAGGRVTFVACVGKDVYGAEAIAGFRRNGIETEHVHTARTSPTGVALIVVDRRGENIIAVASGANLDLSAADIRRAATAFVDSDILLLQLESPLETVREAVRSAARARLPVILNPAPAPASPLPSDLLSQVDILTPNVTEAGMLAGMPDFRPGKPSEGGPDSPRKNDETLLRPQQPSDRQSSSRSARREFSSQPAGMRRSFPASR